MKKKIIAKTLTKVCNGEIEILNKGDNKVYAKWAVYDTDLKLVASFTNNYFIKDKNIVDQDIFILVKGAMLKYRIGREKLFSSVEFA